MNPRSSINMKSLIGTVATWLGTITAWQENLEWFLRVGASVGAIIVTFLTIRSIIRKEQAEHKEPPK